MDLPTQTHLAQLRDLLNYRLQELRAEVHAAQLLQQQSTGTAAREVGDRKDEAAQHQSSSVDSAQEQRDLNEMHQVEAALQRLDGGVYGDCADCGEPISLQRLLVQPAALRCAACQAVFEHRAERSGARRGS